VSPSSRDSISGWLDVLTSMLALPESKRVQVRDELEDHLRSRVDDLLISGMTEPEAVRVAVSELGETAELAQLISHAHTRANPRRRMMNTALILAAIAGLSVGGISWSGGGGWGGAAGGNGGVAVMAEEVEREIEPDVEQVHVFDLEDVTDTQAVEAVAEAFGLEINVSDGLKVLYRERAFPVKFAFKGKFTLDQAIKRLERAGAREISDRVVRYNERELFLMTGDEYARQQIEMRIYPSPVWLSKSDDRLRYASSLTNLLRLKHDLKYASIEVINEAIVVAATPEIHEEVLRFSAELNAMIEERREERRERSALQEEKWQAGQAQVQIEREARNAKNAIEFEKTVQKLQYELDNARKALLDSQEKIREHQNDLNEESMELLNTSRNSETRGKMTNSKTDRLTKAVNELKLEVNENEERYMFLRSRLLESEYAQLFRGLE